MPGGEQSAVGLLQDWPPYDDLLDPINRVFLPRADIATDTLIAGLQEMGWEVDDVTAYRTVRAAPPPAPVRDAIKNGTFDAVVFTSGGVIAAVCGGLLDLGPDGVVALNRVTANGAITKVVVGSGGTSLISFNDHAHFEGASRDLLTYR